MTYTVAFKNNGTIKIFVTHKVSEIRKCLEGKFPRMILDAVQETMAAFQVDPQSHEGVIFDADLTISVDVG